MSETQIKKLNLKALRQQEDTNTHKDESSTASTQKADSAISPQALENPENIQDDKKSDEKSDISPKKISLLSIRKSTENEENTPKDIDTNITPISKQDEVGVNSETQESEKILNKTEEKSKQGVDTSVLLNSDTSDTSSQDQEKSVGKASSSQGEDEPDSSKVAENIEMGRKEKEEEEEEEEDNYEEVLQRAENKVGEKKARGLLSIFKRKKKSTLDNKTNTQTEKNEEEKKQEEVHFDNYTSSFEEQSINVLKRIQNFKYTPSTRIGLLLSLISVTCIIIASLMILFPEKHNTQVYKASILQALGKTPVIDEESVVKESNNKAVNDINSISQEEENDDTPVESIYEEEIQRKEENKKKIKEYILNKYGN